MSYIRESGSVEQEADVILFLFRESYYDKETDNPSLEIIVSKNRNAPVGTIAVNYNEHIEKIEDQKEMSPSLV
jgi:replicative DNA helicase